MNIKDQKHIKQMRAKGCSYGQIARLLNMPRSTVSTHCQVNNIKPQTDCETRKKKPFNYHICRECGELFEGKINREQYFCSDKCRISHWRKEKADEKYLEEEARIRREEELALKKELDLFRKESDEWYRANAPVVIGCRPDPDLDPD